MSRSLQPISSIAIAFIAVFSIVIYAPRVYALTCDFGSPIAGGECRGYITDTAATSWTVPADWSAANTIEIVGAGGDGAMGRSGGAGGGGGGAYAEVSDVSGLSGSIPISVAAGGSGSNTYFNGANCAAATVCAAGGQNGSTVTGGTGGAAASSVGTTKYDGGSGGSRTATGYGGAGGGGAAGPSGPGGNGGNEGSYGAPGGGGANNGASAADDTSTGTTAGGNGADNGTGTGGAGGAAIGPINQSTQAAANGSPGGSGIAPGSAGGGSGGAAINNSTAYCGVGGAGGSGTEWDASHGAGAGGGGAGAAYSNAVCAGGAQPGGDGGTYGGGGGGGAFGNGTNSAGGAGGQGLIVITYTPTAPWYNNSWGYRIKVTVDHTKVGSTLTNFPVYVDLSNLPASFFSHVKSDGGDIRVTEYDGTTEIPREVVAIDTSGDTGELYFKAPSLSSTEDTGFYIYYGNASASDYAVTDTYGRNAVWSNDYALVTHDGGSVDSTGNNANGTLSGTITTGEVSGKLGTAGNYDGSGYASFADDSSLDFTSQFTLLGWVYPTDLTTPAYPALLAKDHQAQWAVIMDYSVTGSTSGSQRFVGSIGGARQDFGTVNSPPVNQWSLITDTYDGSALDSYLNASLSDTEAMSGAIGVSSKPLTIGYWTPENPFIGKIDEVRISSIARSADWISAEYANQNNPSTFLSIGTEDVSSSGGGGDSGGGGTGGSSTPARVIRLFAGHVVRIQGKVVRIY